MEQSSRTNRQKWLNSLWICVKRGYFVCCKNHFARQRHGSEEVSKAMEILKGKHPRTLSTVKDLATMNQMDKYDEGEENCSNFPDHVTRRDVKKDAVLFLVRSGGKKIEKYFAMDVFLHEKRLDDYRIETYFELLNSRDWCYKNFHDLIFDICANKTSFICEC